MKHFTYFPKINYSDYEVTNILVRARLREVVTKNSAVAYDYVIEDGDRADIIASKYYGNSDYTWCIFYANNIYDPLHDWPKTTKQFYNYIKQKYGSVEKAMSQLEEPHHYLLDDTFVIDKDTYYSSEFDFSRKRLVTHYEHEFNLNEEKRNIKIIDVSYLRQIANEMKIIFK